MDRGLKKKPSGKEQTSYPLQPKVTKLNIPEPKQKESHPSTVQSVQMGVRMWRSLVHLKAVDVQDGDGEGVLAGVHLGVDFLGQPMEEQ